MTLPGPIAYLTGEYPRATDTFIQREVAALRRLGAEIETCTIRPTDPAHHVGEDQRREHAATFQVQRTARRPWRLIGAHVTLFMRNPRRWVRALGLAWRTRPPGGKALLWQLFYFAEAGVLAARLRRRGIVHLHNHFGNSSCSVAMLASQLSGIPFSYTMHGPAIFFEPKHWRIDEKIARAAFVACISHFCRAQGMIFADPAHWGRMRIVHCGVEPARYGTAPKGAPGKHILFVGRLAAIKGVPLLLEAFGRIAAEHPDARLTLVGDGPDRPALEARTRALGLEGAVTFTGYQSQERVAELLDAADLFVLPSFAEGVPVVLMEAMAAGLPVIGPRVAGVAELVEDGVAGYVVPPGDPDTLTVRIRSLLDDPEAGRKMGKAGRNRVETEFDIDKEARWLMALLVGSLTGALPEGLRPEPRPETNP